MYLFDIKFHLGRVCYEEIFKLMIVLLMEYCYFIKINKWLYIKQ